MVEDEYFIAFDLSEALSDVGSVVVGPSQNLPVAMDLAMSDGPIDAAILDIKLGDARVWPLVDLLLAQGVPLLLHSGVDADQVPEPYRGVPFLHKPWPSEGVVARLEAVVREGIVQRK